jgi:hypothetical protein
VPGDVNASYLIDKLEGKTGIAGAKMPLNGDLDANQLSELKAWIEAGAKDD